MLSNSNGSTRYPAPVRRAIADQRGTYFLSKIPVFSGWVNVTLRLHAIPRHLVAIRRLAQADFCSDQLPADDCLFAGFPAPWGEFRFGLSHFCPFLGPFFGIVFATEDWVGEQFTEDVVAEWVCKFVFCGCLPREESSPRK